MHSNRISLKHASPTGEGLRDSNPRADPAPINELLIHWNARSKLDCTAALTARKNHQNSYIPQNQKYPQKTQTTYNPKVSSHS